MNTAIDVDGLVLLAGIFFSSSLFHVISYSVGTLCAWRVSAVAHFPIAAI